ncbi:MAG TPA: nickel-dependent lactate racemase [Anaerolineae bacterium]|nr:nickel-dependent lactate racemase [Anaerolineae bacterium]HIQ06034.1 nickel-dependent lactate racemase [Anaerolineae bacterium]
MYKETTVPYGHETRTLRIPAANLAWVVGPKDVPAVADLPEAIRTAIRFPLGAPTLSELVRQHGTRTVILVDDGTRSTPQKLILPILLDELNAAGVPDRDITILIGLGTHRPMSEAECLERYGEEAVTRVPVENLSQDPRDFVDLGVTPLGVPISLSRRYVESDLSIAVGNIVPHMYAGWAGGAKMIQPGVSSPLTTNKTHLMAGQHVYEILGRLDNPVHREMERIAVQSGLKFIVNVVLNRAGEVVAIVAGDVVAAHRAGVEIARPIYTVEVDECPDIVVASSHPADRDLWQGFKPLNNCGMMVRDGGTLILLIPAPEGIAPDHPQFVAMGQMPGEEVLRQAESGKISDGVAAGTYLALDRTRSRVHIVLVTDGISRDEAAQIGLMATPDFDAALEAALARHGAEARIGIVTHGGDIMSCFK